mmetsp:Transcript_8221/g.23499  ORF Transcript_8221/g.23499 Transcript_8221/m.23499 type:complete len:253 (+) Transcript_8221:1506-2264(+)
MDLRIPRLLRCRDLAILNADLREATVVPQLWHLQTATEVGRAAQVEPRLLELDAGLQQELGDDGRLGHLAQLGDDALPLGDQVEVARECLGVSHQRVVRARQRRVLQAAVWVEDLLAGLNAHLQVRHQHGVLGQLDLRMPHDEPLAGAPLLLEVRRLRVLEAALHADNGLLVLAHGKLLEMIVGLEHHLAHTGASDPLGLESFPLHRCAWVAALSGARGVHGVQREQRLAPLDAANLERQREVLQIHRRRRL